VPIVKPPHRTPTLAPLCPLRHFLPTLGHQFTVRNARWQQKIMLVAGLARNCLTDVDVRSSRNTLLIPAITANRLDAM
jgi:hypothetical protein